MHHQIAAKIALLTVSPKGAMHQTNTVSLINDWLLLILSHQPLHNLTHKARVTTKEKHKNNTFLSQIILIMLFSHSEMTGCKTSQRWN